MVEKLNQYKLCLLINVFGVKPTFLLPIFENDGQYYFQNICNDKIESFSLAELEPFVECEKYNVVEKNFYRAIDSCAFYAIETLCECGYFIGDKKEVLKYYYQHEKVLGSSFSFSNAMKNFAAEERENKEKENNTQLVKCSDKVKAFTEIFFYPKKDLSRYSPVARPLLRRGNKRRYNMKMWHSNEYRMFWRKFQRYNSGTIINLDDGLTFYLETNNFIMPINSLFGLAQNVIKIDSLKGICDSNIVFNELLNMGLKYKVTKRDVLDMMENLWGFNVNNSMVNIEILDNDFNLLSDEHEAVFMFGTKKLDSNLYVILVKEHATNDIYFHVVRYSLGSENIVKFIKRLYKKIKKKIIIIPCCNASRVNIFDDYFANWLSANEDICSVNGSFTLKNMNEEV